MIQVDGHKMSSESLGISGKILNTSPMVSDIDENEVSPRGLTKSPFVPFFNKSHQSNIEQFKIASSSQGP